MRSDVLLKIRNDPNLSTYLKYHSYWYKILIRNPNMINKMVEEMRIEYKLTMKDKIENLGERINLINSLLSVL